jgi:hypothetical protein
VSDAIKRRLLLLHYDRPIVGRQQHVLVEVEDVNTFMREVNGPKASLLALRLRRPILRLAYLRGESPKVGGRFKGWDIGRSVHPLLRLNSRSPIKRSCAICRNAAKYANQDHNLEQLLTKSIKQAKAAKAKAAKAKENTSS